MLLNLVHWKKRGCKKNLCFWLSKIHLAVIIICKVLWTISTRPSMRWYQPSCRYYTGSNTGTLGFHNVADNFSPAFSQVFSPPHRTQSYFSVISLSTPVRSLCHRLRGAQSAPSLLIQSLTRTIKARLCVFVSPIVTIFSFLLFLLGMLCHTLYVPLFLFFLYGLSFFWFCRHFSLVFILFS